MMAALGDASDVRTMVHQTNHLALPHKQLAQRIARAFPAGRLTDVIRLVVPKHFRPIGYLTHLVRTRTNCIVRRGPFQGMRYTEVSRGSAYIPKLLGIYERELARYIELAVERRPRLVVDLGAAEGYYAIGMARRLPCARIVAFEMHAESRDALREMVKLNAVNSRVQVLGKCEPDDLAFVLANESHALIICDVEGYEDRLLNPALVPVLRRLPILVELHDFVIPKAKELMLQRFYATHEITQIWQQNRSRSEFPWRTLGTMLLPRSYLDWAVSEWRPVRMSWLWMEPKAG